MKVAMEMREDSIVRLELVPKSLSYDELSEATGGFSEDSELGHGVFGVVYKAELKSGIQVAIKRMNHAATYRQGIKEFRNEVLIISQLSHRNLIKLRGWCADAARKEYMLVYDLMPNGSLDDILFKSAERTDYPSWPQKFNILTGVADGLDYLHRGSNQQIIHRDIKCSNILMDQDFNAKLVDFGIPRLVDPLGKAATTNMAGTMGYMAPEVFSEFRFTEKADVYAFGVVMLEVACGRRVLSSFPHNMCVLQWVRSAYTTGNLLSVADKRHTAFDTKQMKMVLKVGLLCTESNPIDRPSMRSIVQMLAGDLKVPVTPGLKATAERSYRPPGIMRNLDYSECLTRSAPLVDDTRVAVDVPPVTAAASGGAHITTSVNSLNCLVSDTLENPGSVDLLFCIQSVQELFSNSRQITIRFSTDQYSSFRAVLERAIEDWSRLFKGREPKSRNGELRAFKSKLQSELKRSDARSKKWNMMFQRLYDMEEIALKVFPVTEELSALRALTLHHGDILSEVLNELSDEIKVLSTLVVELLSFGDLIDEMDVFRKLMERFLRSPI